MKTNIFRQYDIRGIIGQEWVEADAYHIAKAYVVYVKEKNSAAQTIVVGFDGRVHSQKINECVVKAIRESGLDVISIGLCTTPMMYFSLHTLAVDGGIMITASHNGPAYNGLKLCCGKESIAGENIQYIKDLVLQSVTYAADTLGTYKEYMIVDAYTDFLMHAFEDLKGWDKHIIIDCGNGAAGVVIPLLVEKMGWSNMQVICAEVDGTFPHHEADPTVEANILDLKETVINQKAWCGVGFDGDADRMGAITSQGALIPGDKLLALFSSEIIKSKQNVHVVADIKCSAMLENLISEWGGVFHAVPSGHSNIKHAMKKHKSILGGELSCHFFFHDRYFGYDDGVYAMLRLFEIMQKYDQQLETLLTLFPKTYATNEMRISCNADDMPHMIKAIDTFFEQYQGAKKITVDGVRVIIDDGWGLIRGSNTQPVICLRFEAKTIKTVCLMQNLFKQALQEYPVIGHYFNNNPSEFPCV